VLLGVFKIKPFNYYQGICDKSSVLNADVTGIFQLVDWI
jgi:hypothetical protein